MAQLDLQMVGQNRGKRIAKRARRVANGLQCHCNIDNYPANRDWLNTDAATESRPNHLRDIARAIEMLFGTSLIL